MQAPIDNQNAESLGKVLDSIERGTEIMDKKGTTSVIALLAIAFIAYVVWRTYTDWRKFKTKEIENDLDFKNQKLKDDMEMSKKTAESDFELKKELTKAVGGLSSAVITNSQAIDRTENSIETHNDNSMNQFKALNEKLDDISTKMEIAFDKSNELETKTMLNEMNKEIKLLSNSIREAKGGKDE